jgi:hypothetical protein
MEESFLRRKTVTGESSMSTTSAAFLTSMGRDDAPWCFLSSAWTDCSIPTRMMPTPYSFAACTAPATMAWGA